ncbi:MAG: hypothetical protein A3J07_02460 [Candidatus Doudnabacteria bacterium RIFCSPLOWO2_02_FULL_49_13]|uniref:Sortase n=1 Tax=Candidatus Doudnabacteria bacterium RIFCSPHIGHO2_12_FULL_48_16 TaxID=1817838 RepID=A0A1F5PKU7_9BACT|nr:MAG: hypothetical protein A3B77_03365 [Candidatus Doudnabacteria bacterium RIFCSPHIGHO2_02_FULL_49_24]OGE89161.1 MAG: hypothetical protein A2760_02110 [Candidatus Doudnabacteria bacterium RIFCSPHIGHO2_01_FULL_50_67]OGE90543.1 MAG: hypothetical protein A3E29_01975 [Candidatus Doudnabacteria bacterium RIFCSPHIGHO2_12_FULL_48_16]OGE97187.1 MAG: hypothetical protein A2990_01140 [Candidatus Doudnabacteria bacterium RIFCSPLOWO2_01_FULL_49_40]OGF02935.1 MAG: hypothetical protein A3J07_02460 [Candid
MNQESGIEKRALILILGLVLIFFWFRPAKHMEQKLPDQIATKIPANLIIEKLSLFVPIIEAASNDELAIQVALERGVVHLAGTSEPGKVGNCYIVGHSSDYPSSYGSYKSVFARLPELVGGDEIRIKTPNESFVYRIFETRIVEATDLSVLAQDSGGRKLLTLQTSYPIGTARQRFLVVAQLVEK